MIIGSITSLSDIADTQFSGFAGYLFFNYKIKKNLLVRDSIWTNSQTNIPNLSKKKEDYLV